MIAVFGQCGRESESGDDAGAPIDFVRAAAGTAVTGDGRAAVAGQLGVSPGEVAAMIGDLSLLKRGVFFDVDTVGLGAIGSRQLPWSLFGLDDPATEATLGVRFSPPRVMLAPDEYRLPILRAADEAHALLGR